MIGVEPVESNIGSAKKLPGAVRELFIKQKR
jgi:hypothetical protein